MRDESPDCVRAVLAAATRALSGDDAARDAPATARDEATRAALADARGEAEILLAHVLRRDRTWLYAHDDALVDASSRERYDALVAARRRGTPVAYLTASREFWSLPLRVTDAVLIPRADTETLVELALARLPAGEAVDVVDLGTGSGAIALAIAHARPHARVVATDASDDALQVARDNARAVGMVNVEFAHGHWWHAVARRRFAIAVSNPPYLRDDDPHLARGDLRFEPRHALASGRDGLDAIREIVAGAADHLRSRGWLLLEHGYDQGDAARALLAAAGFDEVFTAQDLGGNDRVSGGRRPD